jgi:hypothetical protein
VKIKNSDTGRYLKDLLNWYFCVKHSVSPGCVIIYSYL